MRDVHRVGIGCARRVGLIALGLFRSARMLDYQSLDVCGWAKESDKFDGGFSGNRNS